LLTLTYTIFATDVGLFEFKKVYIDKRTKYLYRVFGLLGWQPGV